jgi:hypothetical protein
MKIGECYTFYKIKFACFVLNNCINIHHLFSFLKILSYCTNLYVMSLFGTLKTSWLYFGDDMNVTHSGSYLGTLVSSVVLLSWWNF